MRFDVVTIFPKMIEAGLAEGVVGRAIDKGIVQVGIHDLRDFTTDRHRTVDDVPYGGGPGMVMKPEPLVAAVEHVRSLPDAAEATGEHVEVVMLSPQGRLFTQAEAARLRGRRRVVLVCGRYEGIDERVREELGATELSIGDFVVSGGELPALIVIDAVSRLVPGVVGDEQSVAEDSFSRGLLDHPHYTRPASFRGRAVPEVLMSGHHAAVRRWRRKAALRQTLRMRPELLAVADLDREDRALLDEIRREDVGEGDGNERH